MSFLRHKKIYQSDGLKRELNCSFSSLTDHRSDESSTGYSFMSCSPAGLTSASPVLQSFSLNLAAVKPSAANRNCPSYSLSQPRGPLQGAVQYLSPENTAIGMRQSHIASALWTATLQQRSVPPTPKRSPPRASPHGPAFARVLQSSSPGELLKSFASCSS